MTTTDSDSFLKDIRLKMSDVMKDLDDFLEMVAQGMKTKSDELDEKVRKYQILKAREQKLLDYEKSLEKRENIIKESKKNQRDKQIALDKREAEIEKRLERLKNILN